MIKVFHSLEEFAGSMRNDQAAEAGVHLALGVFDGVHVGHQEVIKTAVEAAQRSGGVAGVLTFSPHPIQVLAPNRAPKRILASLSHKAKLLEELGCEVRVVQEFNLEFASCRARVFVGQIVEASGKLRSISVGEDWQFGKGREGNVTSLKRWGDEMGFEVFASEPIMGGGERVSSTRIRQAIRDGNLIAIHEMLGRPYMVMGEVLKGRQLARQLGFPTANIKVHNEQLPPDGVWAVSVEVDGEWFDGVGNLGKRPTVENDAEAQRLLEVHLFDFHRDLYGLDLVVRFESYVREEKKFAGIEELKAQIEKDVAQVRGEIRDR